MWKQDVIDKVNAIHNGEQGAKAQQMLMKEYMEFYGVDEGTGNQGYSIGYKQLMDIFNGTVKNQFLYIEYVQTHELVYVKD